MGCSSTSSRFRERSASNNRFQPTNPLTRVFGSVNANRTHYEQGAEALVGADRQWLDRLLTRRVPLRRWREAMEHRENDVKTVITLR